MYTTTRTPWLVRSCYRLLAQINPEYESVGIVYLHKTDKGYTWLVNEYDIDPDLAMGPVARFISQQAGNAQLLSAENDRLRQQLADKEKTHDTGNSKVD